MLHTFLLAFLLVLSPQNLYADSPTSTKPHLDINTEDILAYLVDGSNVLALAETKEFCPQLSYFDAYYLQPDMTTTIGCWTDNKNQDGVLITWSGGDTITASDKSFTFVKQRYF